VGDADRGQLVLADAGGGERLADHLLGALPDLAGVVLDPARPRVDLLVLLLGDRHDPAAVVEDHEPGARGALVDRRRVLSHVTPPIRSLCPTTSARRTPPAARSR